MNQIEQPIRGLFLLAIAWLLSGCTLRYVPSDVPIETASIPPFKAVGSVQLTNTQESLEDVPVPLITTTLTVNYRLYTEVALKALRSELDKKSGASSSSHKKEIKLAIVDLKIIQMAGNMRSIVNATVMTGDGYIRGIEVIGASWDFRKAIDTAVANVAVGVLNDEKILDYLEK